MDAEGLDQRPHLRLGAAQQHRPPASSQTAGEQRQIDHQRHVGGAETGEIDGDVGLSPQSPGDRAPAKPLRGAVLIPGAEEDRRCLGETDDV
jgi:hypothetical protein